jgi:hypothetical protein
VAILDNGILGKWRGKLGNLSKHYRPHSVFDDNAYTWVDRRSDEQLERRRRFKLIVPILSKLYLPLLKPYYKYKHSFTTALDVAAGLTLENYEEWNGLPSLRLFKSRYPTFPNVVVFTEGPGSFMYVSWEFGPQYYWEDCDFVRAVVIQMYPSLKISTSAPIEYSANRYPFAVSGPWAEMVPTLVCIHAFKQVGSDWIISGSEPLYFTASRMA